MPCIRPCCTVRACVRPTDRLSYHRSVSHAGRDSGDMAVTSRMPAYRRRKRRDEESKEKSVLAASISASDGIHFKQVSVPDEFHTARQVFQPAGRQASRSAGRPDGPACTQVILGTIDINETDFIKMVL